MPVNDFSDFFEKNLIFFQMGKSTSPA